MMQPSRIHLKLLKTIVVIFCVLELKSIDAVDCGRWYSNPCLGDDDVRYDPHASDNIVDQGPVWRNLSGYWKYKVYAFDPTGRPQEPSASNPNQPFFVGGFPYSYSPAYGFLNMTIVGSRIYQHRYLIFQPADTSFCNEELSPGFVNVLGNGTCGVTGYSLFSELFGTSTYERDGTVMSLPLDLATDPLGIGLLRDGTMYRSQPIDNQTIYTIAKDSTGAIMTETLVLLDSSNSKLSSVSDFYIKVGNQMQMVAFFRADYTRLKHENAFILALDDAYKESAVLGADRVQNGQVPMKTACLSESCPSETNWCAMDPSCSVSRYQEPPGSMRVDVLTGLVITAVIFFVGSFYLLHRYRLRQQEIRFRTNFAKRVADAIEVSESFYALDASKLLEEFQSINPNGDGLVLKERMKEFMQSGKVGYISESDFGALWAVMDMDNSGSVDFLEFCAFLAQCEHLLKDKDTNRDWVMKAIADRLSAISRHDVSVRARSVASGDMFVDESLGRAFPEYDSISLQSTLPSLESSPPRVAFAAKSLGTGLFS